MFIFITDLSILKQEVGDPVYYEADRRALQFIHAEQIARSVKVGKQHLLIITLLQLIEEDLQNTIIVYSHI